MTYFPDVNLWIALAYPGHIHHPAALHWFGEAPEDELAFCRITQMGLLRLLTNRLVMGVNVLTPASAWRVYDDFERNPRIVFANEPPGIEIKWRNLHQPVQGPNSWTDAYLASFAIASDFTLVTFDAQLARRRNVRAHHLK
jgi:toxin-antitoxin system PIN domain toxin